MKISEMMDNLYEITEEAYGEYAFEREPLKRKINSKQRKEMIQKAIMCGREEAKEFRHRFGVETPKTLYEKLGLHISYSPEESAKYQIVFAQFIEPNQIVVFQDVLYRIEELQARESLTIRGHYTVEEIMLAHELFHFVESLEEQTIYTRTERIELWHRPFSNKSPIAVLSEIGGMAFAKELLGLDFCPFMLDVLLLYAFDTKSAEALHKKIICYHR